MENTRPWEEPRIAFIISLFNGRVSSIVPINEVKFEAGDTIENDIQR